MTRGTPPRGPRLNTGLLRGGTGAAIAARPSPPRLLLRKPATSATKNKRLAIWRKSRKALVRKVAQLALAKTGGAGASTAARAGGSTRGDPAGDANLRGQLYTALGAMVRSDYVTAER